MFEITYKDREWFEKICTDGKTNVKGEYDFTFENQFVVFHSMAGQKYRYGVLDVKSMKSSEIVGLRDNLCEAEEHSKMIPVVLEALKYTGSRHLILSRTMNPIHVIDMIFRIVLPYYGYNIREEQIELSKTIYEGLVNKTVSICEAEVGTGKTLAYLIAAVIARNYSVRYKDLYCPVTITTSSIELQMAIFHKEIPQLSKMLQKFGVIDKPLVAVLRKGKEHYLCVKRLELFKENNPNYTSFSENISKLESGGFDLDLYSLPNSVKKSICVKESCYNCKYAEMCKYKGYIGNSKRNERNIDFQITNHNLFLASLTHSNILSDGRFVIVDEAHKLKDTAQSMFTYTLDMMTVKSVLNRLSKNTNEVRTKRHIHNLCADIEDFMFRTTLSETEEVTTDAMSQPISCEFAKSQLKRLKNMALRFNRICENLSIIKGESYIETKTLSECFGKLLDDTYLPKFCGQNIVIMPKSIEFQMYRNIWRSGKNFVLTSGTMSDEQDSFNYYIRQNGINFLYEGNVRTFSVSSPFNYTDNTIRYVPPHIPIPDNDSDEYIEAISSEILKIVEATNGHTAILFTSYRALQLVYQRIGQILNKRFEVICMSKSNKEAINKFKKSKNAVLFASGAMWEGVDCSGDCLSSLIIVRLPFPIPDEHLGDMNINRLRSDIIPQMIISLRQGLGRLIRSESDTGVISILDSRAYKPEYKSKLAFVLKKYPKVDSLEEVHSFIQKKKSKDYFDQ